ncbi:hypothetical protein MXD81_14145, partial [Microbacteriaceae bacterium K1510]|nr:hypothetical protein [Microbacteriaceae bacterium K1510]
DIGVAYYEGPDLIGYAGLEWMPLPDRPLSIFAKGSISEHNDEASSILGGLKFYFSPETKSLIRRHREDDPDVDLASDLYLAPQLPPDLFQTANGVCPPGEVLVNGSCDGNT